MEEKIYEDFCSKELSKKLKDSGYCGANSIQVSSLEKPFMKIPISCAIKWLRKVYGIVVSVDHTIGKPLNRDWYSKVVVLEVVIEVPGLFNSYEEAAIAGIEKALTLC